MKTVVLVIASVAVLAALALLAREVRATDPVAATNRVEPRVTAPRIVMPAGVEAPATISGGDGMPELPAATVDTLATMPGSAPIRPDTIEAPRAPTI